MSFLEVASEITELGYQVKILNGTVHGCAGYAVHQRFLIEVKGLKRYCERCRELYGVDLKEDFGVKHHQHSHRAEYPVVFYKEYDFDEYKNISNDLIELRKKLVNLIA